MSVHILRIDDKESSASTNYINKEKSKLLLIVIANLRKHCMSHIQWRH